MKDFEKMKMWWELNGFEDLHKVKDIDQDLLDDLEKTELKVLTAAACIFTLIVLSFFGLTN